MRRDSEPRRVSEVVMHKPEDEKSRSEGKVERDLIQFFSEISGLRRDGSLRPVSKPWRPRSQLEV